jgi:hypothetical protein
VNPSQAALAALFLLGTLSSAPLRAADDATPCRPTDAACPNVEFVNSTWGASLHAFGEVVDVADVWLEIHGKHLGAKGSTVTVIVMPDAAAAPVRVPGAVAEDDMVSVKAPPLGSAQRLAIAVETGGRTSAPFDVAIHRRDAPLMVRTNPENPTRGQTVRIEGAGFTATTKVELDEKAIDTTYVSPTALEVRWPADRLEAHVTVKTGELRSEPVGVRVIATVQGKLRLPAKVTVRPAQVHLLDHREAVTPDEHWNADLRIAGQCDMVVYGRFKADDRLPLQPAYGQALVSGTDVSPVWDTLATAVAAALAPRLLSGSERVGTCAIRARAAALPEVMALATAIDQNLTNDTDVLDVLRASRPLVEAAMKAAAALPGAP